LVATKLPTKIEFNRHKINDQNFNFLITELGNHFLFIAIVKATRKDFVIRSTMAIDPMTYVFFSYCPKKLVTNMGD
jgi:hypothetical protein